MNNIKENFYKNLCKYISKKNNISLKNKVDNFKKYTFKLTILFIKLLQICGLLKTNFSIITNTKNENYINYIIKTSHNNLENYTIAPINKIKNKKFNSIFINSQNINIILKKNNLKTIKQKPHIIKKKHKKIYNTLSYYNKSQININNKKINLFNFINNFSTYTKSFIFGQENNISKISDKLLNLNNTLSKKPIASYFLCGPSGTGKTEISKIISTYIYKKNTKLIHIDMSEYMEENSVSKLIGSSPGHVGSNKTGFLIKKILKNPNSVVLFDEVEKANKNIYSLFLQILDEGVITSSNTKKGYFNKSIIVFTSNLGSDILNNIEEGYTLPSGYDIQTIKKIKNHFKPELINRLDDIIIFNPLGLYSYNLILNKFIKNKPNDNINIKKSIKSLMLVLCYYPLKGSRFLFNNVNSVLLPINYDDNIIFWCDKFFNCVLQ